MVKYCIFPKSPGCFCEKCKDFTGSWQFKCDKCKCNLGCVASVWELEREYPQYKNLLENWKRNNSKYSSARICSQCWRKDILEEFVKAENNRNKKAADEHNASHCYTCDSKSTIFHLIYDKSKNEYWESWSNATDPENQLVFCNETCLRKYQQKEYIKKNSYTCSNGCGKSGVGEYFCNKTDSKKRKFCSPTCYKDFWTKKANKKARKSQAKINKLNEKASILTRKKLEVIEKLMELNYDIDFDFENDDLLNEEQKELCRKYQAGREKIKRLEKEKDNLSQGNTDDDETTPDEGEKTCDQCGKKGTSYNLRDANDGKEFCSKPCAVTYYSKDNPNLEENCDKCNKKIGKGEDSYYKDAKNKTGNLCSNCWELRRNEGNSQIDDELWERLKAEVRNGVSSAEAIIEKYGDKLTTWQKRTLRDYDNSYPNTEGTRNKGGLIAIAAIIGLVIIFSVIIVKAKNRKKKF